MEAHLKYIFCTLLFYGLLNKGTSSLTQEDLDYIANSLEIKVKVVDNLEFDGGKHLFHVTLYNSGKNIIQGYNWTIYFYSFFMIESDHLPKDGGVVLESQNIRLNHVQGCLFSLEPVSGFGDIETKETKSLKFFGQNWAVSKSDIPPNWYIDAPYLKPRLLRSTRLSHPSFVANFVLPKQWKRFKNDKYNPFTPENRYNRYKIEDLGKAVKLIIPTPKETQMDESSHVTLDSATWRIRADAVFKKEAQFLAGKANLPFEESNIPDMSVKTISLIMNNTMDKEEYYLSIDPTAELIFIKGRTTTGVFYGIQSLLSLLDGSTDRKLPKTEVKDKPRFEYRGMHIDVARNFHDKDNIIRLMDAMAMYKMNKLHFHLTDDEGWRVEIKDLPELTDIGSKRCHDLRDDICLIPQLGSGPDNSTSGSGFFTRNEYIDIIKYANERHIEVIPEVDMPGHARAAIKAMEARYKRLRKGGQEDADKYRLIDPNDSSDYLTAQMFNDNSVNPCIESTYNFISKVVQELMSMHKTAGQPLNKYHFGGDEVATGAWKHSPACNGLSVNGTELTGRELYKQYFAQRVANLTQEKELNLVGWEDGLMDKDKKPYERQLLVNVDVIANAWDNVWEWGSAKRAYALANQNYKVVLAHATHLNYGHPYEPDPEEGGLYWATRYADTFKAFGYNADDLYKNIDTMRSGAPITRAEVCKPDNSGCPPLNKPQNIIGMQGHLWSETALTKELFDYMIFPRILAVAERAWHKASWEVTEDKESREGEILPDWQYFANTIGYKELNRLEHLGVYYRIPPPGAILKAGKLKVNTEFPSLKVEYRDENGDLWRPVTDSFKPQDNILLRTKSVNGHRNSREIKFILPTDQLLINYIADYLKIKLDVVDNLVNGSRSFILKIQLTNLGTKPIRAGTWSIYMYLIRLAEPFNFPYPDGFLIAGSGFRIFHVAGSLYKFAPDPETFKSIQPNMKSVLQFRVKYWQSAKTDSMPNWYIAADGFEPRTIKSTAGEKLDFVGPFDTVNKWKRYPNDKYNPYLPRTRFVINDNIKDLGKPGKHLIPTPYMMTLDDQSKVSITSGHWVVLQSDEFRNEVDYLIGKTKLAKVSTKPSSMFISFIKDAVFIKGVTISQEAYKLDVDTANSIVTITANHPSGAFYGIQSLLRLSKKIPKGIQVPKVEIADQPRFGYRGMHLDVGRNFHSLEEIKLLLNAMAMYKLNKFHFHLSEDEGWRIEIPGLKELTEVGSKRCHDLKEETCTLPQLGSGPKTDSSGTGYYTVEQYKEILREAKKLHIQVIPEFDMPGHARAAIKSMEHRYNKFKAMGNITRANEFLLSEFGDPSKYLSAQWFNDNAINPCLESTFSFIHHLMKSMKMLHKDIQPLSLYHFGGDEVAHGAWLNSTACQSLMNKTSNIKTVSDLKEYFAKRVGGLAEEVGVDIGAWEDGVMKTLTDPFEKESLIKSPRNVYGYSWKNLFESGSVDHAYVLANAGYKVVLVHATHLYFDHPYEPDPEERGYYWATRFTDTFKTFGYVPDNIYVNSHLTTSGVELTKEQICKEKCLQLKKPENIVGIQGALWSETSRTSPQLHSMLFPRLLALAERAWHKSPWENITNRDERNKMMTKEWEEFANTLGYKELGLLDEMGVKYRVPPPGAKIEKDRLHVNSRFYGLEIEYSTDNETTWKSAMENPEINGGNAIKLRTRSADKSRTSRIITLPETSRRVSSSATHWNINIVIFISIIVLGILF